MDFLGVFSVPMRPKLRFGESLEEVCGGRGEPLHPGLRDLFVKAYVSARGDEFAEEDEQDTVGHPVLLALRSGGSGQGGLVQRLALKERLERGDWLLPAQTPAGAPLWLLRHFLGRLPRPLLRGSQWKALAAACGEAGSDPDELLTRTSELLGQMSHAEYQVLGLLGLLTRNLCREREASAEDELSGEALEAVSEYLTPSISARPFRPGLCTQENRRCQPLLVFLARHWPRLFLGPSQQRAARPSYVDIISEKLDECFGRGGVCGPAEDIPQRSKWAEDEGIRGSGSISSRASTPQDPRQPRPGPPEDDSNGDSDCETLRFSGTGEAEDLVRQYRYFEMGVASSNECCEYFSVAASEESDHGL